jgi:hypothetical protein
MWPLGFGGRVSMRKDTHARSSRLAARVLVWTWRMNVMDRGSSNSRYSWGRSHEQTACAAAALLVEGRPWPPRGPRPRRPGRSCQWVAFGDQVPRCPFQGVIVGVVVLSLSCPPPVNSTVTRLTRSDVPPVLLGEMRGRSPPRRGPVTTLPTCLTSVLRGHERQPP